MKTLNAFERSGWWLMICLGLALLSVAQAALNNADQPSITAIRLEGTNVVVAAQVPEGITKVTLESRSRLGAGNWEPVAVVRLDGPGREVVFRLPVSAKLELLRVRADAQEALPSFFYRGTNTFNGALSTAANFNSNDAFLRGGAETAPTAGADSSKSRDVVESDIWTISGNLLYFFNQYRGLQVIDLSDPNVPVVRGTLNLPAAGEQMYLLDTNYVVLLAQDGSSWWGSSGTESRVLVVRVANGIPSITVSLPVSGYIQESRLVGTALYVASQTYQPVYPPTKDGVSSTWEWGTQVSAFDLADPDKPVARGTLWYSGYGNVVSATDRFFFVASQGSSSWWQSVVRCIDISAPDGTMKPLSSINLAGQVPDKFKLNVSGDVFTAISQAWNDTRRWVTTLQTFSLADPTAPKQLGSLELAHGEQLHATRFDGDRVYIVTFFRIDPLWVVDLSDPAHPQIKGELQVPGWSTYIQPLGNRLVTIGIDNSNSWRVAVSLFDVEDPAKPSLVSKVPLGQNYSWSEANNDEKAFNVMPEAGLILVPYQGDFTNGYASRVQLIDLNLDDPTSNALRLRGTIEHQFQPRRATLFDDHILSISGKELLSVDATDRDHPLIRSNTELAWAVNELFLQGNFLVEIAYGSVWGWSWNSQDTPTLRVTSANDPGAVLTRISLTNVLPIIGAAVREGRLYVLQGVSGYDWPYLVANAKSADYPWPFPDYGTNPPPLSLSVYDLAKLPELNRVGLEQVALTNFNAGSMQAVWPKPGLLVWSGGGGYYWGPWLEIGGIRVGGAAFAGDVAIGFWRPWPWYGSGGGRLFAFNVAEPAAPQFVSEVNLVTNGWWSFSSAYTADGLVYLSHQASEFVEGVVIPGQMPPAPTVVVDATTGKTVTNQPPIGVWVQRYYLDVVDYKDASSPVVRKPVNIPGILQGLSFNGALLYTQGQHWANDGTTDWSEWLDASAYDGVSAHLVDSLALPREWPHPLRVHGANIFIGRPDNSTNSLHSLETWTLPETGRFTRLGALRLSSPAADMAEFGDLLAVQTNDGFYKLFDATDAAKLRLVGSDRASGWVSGDLHRADGALDRGLWLPLGDYGVKIIGLSP